MTEIFWPQGQMDDGGLGLGQVFVYLEAGKLAIVLSSTTGAIL